MPKHAELIAGAAADGPRIVPCAGGTAGILLRAAPIEDRTNEDAALILPLGEGRALLAVADGASGHPAGDQASKRILEAIRDAIRRLNVRAWGIRPRRS